MNSSFLSRRRGSLAISVAILKASKKGILKTHLIYSISLSHEQINRYLRFLEANGFLENNDNLYKTTEKGVELITEFESSPLTRSILIT